MAEAGHFQRIGYAATGFLGQILQVGRRVVMRDQHCILLFHQRLDAGLERIAFLGAEYLLHHRGRLDHGFDRNRKSWVHRSDSGFKKASF